MNSSRERKLMRTIDMLVASATICVASPLWILIAASVKLSSPGPILHRSTRAGLNGEHFTILKFRTMRVGNPGPAVTAGGDDRITRVGKVLRRWKLDELPQMINVWRGDMSLVGPRPEDPKFVAAYSSEEYEILQVRPGLVSPATLGHLDEETQLAEAVANGEDAESYYVEHIAPIKLRADLEYVRNWTVGGDLRLMARLPRALLDRCGHEDRSGQEATHVLADQPEIERVVRVYDSYGRGAESRWDPDKPANRMILSERNRMFEHALSRIGFDRRDCVVVEVGCGTGQVLDTMRELLPRATIIGLDIHLDRLKGVARFPVARADARRLPLPSESVDVITTSVLFSSVARESWAPLARELCSALKPGGAVLWYDMRLPNPFNRHTAPVTRRDLERLFPQADIDVRPLTLLPHAARMLGTRVNRWYGPLVRFRPARSHLGGTIRPRRSSGSDR